MEGVANLLQIICLWRSSPCPQEAFGERHAWHALGSCLFVEWADECCRTGANSVASRLAGLEGEPALLPSAGRAFELRLLASERMLRL